MNRKNSLIATAFLMLTALPAVAQTEVTIGVMRGKDYGVTYMLPKTEIIFSLEVTKHTYTPGKLCQYAGQYLQLNDISGTKTEYWTLDNIQMQTAGVPDKDNVYFVKLKDKTVAPLMELTEDGIVRSINRPLSGKKKQQAEEPVPNKKKQLPDPKRFLTEEMLLANSTAKQAELIAKEIYNIRESRNALLRGEAENTPQDGEQLKLMLDNLELQERSLAEMFTGHTVEETKTIHIKTTPEEMKGKVIFRFSRKLGLLDWDDLAGEPYYLDITNLNPLPEPVAEPEGKKKKKEESLEGIAYRVPGRARIILRQGNNTLLKTEVPVTQFGTIEYLAPVLFNKNSTIQVLFDTTTGGLIKVER